MKAAAQKYLDLGFQPLPLDKSGDGKAIYEDGWKTREYTANDFSENNNIGLNLLPKNKEALSNVDPDSENAIYFCKQFLLPTATLGLKSLDGKKVLAGTSYFYKGKLDVSTLARKYPDGKIIAELRGEGNIVVAPSIAESRFFDHKFVERAWIDERQPAENAALEKQFNQVCVASVLRDYIKGFNMPVVKLTACLKRYCTDWQENEIYTFIETLVDSIPSTDKKHNSERKKVRSKIKTVLKNWDNPETHQAGYESFADHVGLDHKYCRDMFSWIGKVPNQETKNDRKTIISFKANAMTEADFHKKIERSYLVPPIICDKGLYVFAGKPKGGKSRILKDLGYKVQNPDLGTWIGHTVANGDVLLLALEDNIDSMNIDIKEMGYQHKKKPTTFVEIAPTLDRGLEESIKLWTEEVPNPRLVILDTFQKIKPLGEQKTRNANAYEVDYHYLSKLHTLARELNICIIYVHHLSQADKTHSWDKIMGSTGHQGVTDAMYMLEREEGTNQATFKGIGRNIAEFKMDIEWNNLTYKFDYVGDSYLRKTAKHKKDIFKAMVALAKQGSGSVKPADVYKVLNLVTNKEKNTCNKNMQRMRKNHELREGEAFGEYKLPYKLEAYGDDGELLSGNEPWSPFNVHEINAAESEEQFELDQFGKSL